MFMSDHLKIWDGNEGCLNQIHSTTAEVHRFYMASDLLEYEKTNENFLKISHNVKKYGSTVMTLK